MCAERTGTTGACSRDKARNSVRIAGVGAQTSESAAECLIAILSMFGLGCSCPLHGNAKLAEHSLLIVRHVTDAGGDTTLGYGEESWLEACKEGPRPLYVLLSQCSSYKLKGRICMNA